MGDSGGGKEQPGDVEVEICNPVLDMRREYSRGSLEREDKMPSGKVVPKESSDGNFGWVKLGEDKK